MKALVEKHPTIESVYFYAVDRCARRMSIVISVAEWAEKNEINLVFLNPYPITTMIKNKEGKRIQNPLATMVLTMMGFAASMEMEVKLERFKTAKDYLRDNGYATGALLFGYKGVEDDKGRRLM